MIDENTDIVDEAEDILADLPEEPADKEPAPMHTLLQIWKEILSNIEAAETEPIDIQIAGRIVHNYPMIKVQEVSKYMALYSALLIEMRDILLAEIDSDEKCLSRIEDDAEGNRHHYLNLLIDWQRLARQWEIKWDSNSPLAHIEMAAISDASTFVLGQKGLVAHLDEIKFRWTAEDAEMVLEAIQAAE